MIKNKNFLFLNGTNVSWKNIQMFFEASEEEQNNLLSKIDTTCLKSNLSILELLEEEFNLKFKQNNQIEKKENDLTEDIKVQNYIFAEKNKRNQAYSTLDYLLSINSYYDYFSLDAFFVLQHAQTLLTIYKKQKITSDIFLLSFYTINSELIKILKEFNINFDTVEKLMLKKEKTFYSKIQNKYLKKIIKFFSNKKESLIKQIEPISKFIDIYNSKKEKKTEIQLSKELRYIFEKTVSNALRYKTPVITLELLFLNFFNEENIIAGQIIKKLIKNPVQIILLRYRIIKLIHKNECILRNSVIKNQHFFAYLLKTELSDLDFQKLILTNSLSKAVNSFRNELILSTNKINLSDILEKEIFGLSKVNHSRKYSLL
jgi:hypothetical protein